MTGCKWLETKSVKRGEVQISHMSEKSHKIRFSGLKLFKKP